MSAGKYLLYVGAGFAGLSTLICAFLPKSPPLLSYILWGIAIILLIVGSIIDKLKEDYCCGNDYEHIFAVPMNDVRDPDEVNPEKEYKEKIERAYKYRNNIRTRANTISHQYRYAY